VHHVVKSHGALGNDLRTLGGAERSDGKGQSETEDEVGFTHGVFLFARRKRELSREDRVYTGLVKAAGSPSIGRMLTQVSGRDFSRARGFSI
jgi:hypothetical protein